MQKDGKVVNNTSIGFWEKFYDWSLKGRDFSYLHHKQNDTDSSCADSDSGDSPRSRRQVLFLLVEMCVCRR